MADIFLSYKRTDQDRAAPIVDLLRARGWTVWWDTRINAGERWDEVIEREINDASCVLAIWSAQSVNSRWVKIEASEGLERGILVPVLIDRTRPPLEFKRVQAIDLTGWNGDAEERSARTLVGEVARRLGQSPVDMGDHSAEPRGDGGERLSRGEKRRRLVARCRDGTRVAASLAGRFVLAAKARIGGLAVRARSAAMGLREKVARPAVRQQLGRSAAGLSAFAGAIALGWAVWLTGWLDRPRVEVDGALVDIVLKAAQRRLAEGDIKGARRSLDEFEGFAPGRITLALGETYDPNRLAALDLPDVAADPEKAMALYRKARDLGVPGAQRRLDELIAPSPPVAKDAERGPRISAAPVTQVRPTGQAALRIQVVPPEAVPNNAFIRLDGLPLQVPLTEGHMIAPGSWAVALSALPALKASVPAGVAGSSTIIIRLVGSEGTTLAQARTELKVVGPAAGGGPPVRSGEQRERAKRMLARGWDAWDVGNVAGARLFFAPAAEAGLAEAAIGMAKTFDPVELARMAVGTVPDRDQAIKWYLRARELGSLDAEAPLSRLKGR